jgi:hypothetical protein
MKLVSKRIDTGAATNNKQTMLHKKSSVGTGPKFTIGIYIPKCYNVLDIERYTVFFNKRMQRVFRIDQPICQFLVIEKV